MRNTRYVKPNGHNERTFMDITGNTQHLLFCTMDVNCHGRIEMIYIRNIYVRNFNFSAAFTFETPAAGVGKKAPELSLVNAGYCLDPFAGRVAAPPK